MQALRGVARQAVAAGQAGIAPRASEKMMIDLAFALRDRMRRAGPPRYQSSDGGHTLEMKHSAISHRGFAFEVRGRTYIWEDISDLVRQLKRRHPSFLQLLEGPHITWVDALRAQDALLALWEVMRPVDPEGIAWA